MRKWGKIQSLSPINIFFDITSPSNFLYRLMYLCLTLFISLYLIHSLANPSLVSTSILLPYHFLHGILMISVSLRHLVLFFKSTAHSIPRQPPIQVQTSSDSAQLPGLDKIRHVQGGMAIDFVFFFFLILYSVRHILSNPGYSFYFVLSTKYSIMSCQHQLCFSSFNVQCSFQQQGPRVSCSFGLKLYQHNSPPASAAPSDLISTIIPPMLLSIPLLSMGNRGTGQCW